MPHKTQTADKVARDLRPAPTSRRRLAWTSRLLIVLVPCAMALLGWFAMDRAGSLAPRGSGWYLLLAFTALQASILCFAVRLHFSLRAFGIDLSARAASIIALQSLFYFFIPLSIGTDAARWLKIRNRIPDISRMTVLTAVLFDRGTAAVACVVIAASTLPLIPSIRIDIATVGELASSWWVAILAFLAGAALVTMFQVARRRFPNLLPLTFQRRFLLNMVACLGLSLLTQGFMILTVWSGLQWLGVLIKPAAISLGVTGAAIAQVIPLSVAGAGPGEVTAGVLLTRTGASTDEAVLVATLVYFCKLIGGIEGGLLEWPPISRRLHA